MLKVFCFLFGLAALLAPPANASLARSYSAKDAFAKKNICPSTHKFKLPCPGYVIDHKTALDCGGLDAPANMQYQTIAAGKAKDRIERRAPSCKHRQL